MSVLPLPRWAHRPGQTAAADHAPLDAAKALVPVRFEGQVPADHPAFSYGLELNAAHFFWEAHEVWEAVWMAAPQNGLDRLALRALIQIANAGLKREMGQTNAVRRLIGEAMELLGRNPAARRHTRWWRGGLRHGQSPDRVRGMIRPYRVREHASKCIIGLIHR